MEVPPDLKAYSCWGRLLTYLVWAGNTSSMYLRHNVSVMAKDSPWLAQAHFADSLCWSHSGALEWEVVVWTTLPPHKEFCNLPPMSERLPVWFREPLLCFLPWGTIISSPPGRSVTGQSTQKVDGGISCPAVAIHTNDLFHMELAQPLAAFV